MARRSSSYYSDYYFYEPTKAREVKGGIKAQTRRGQFVSQWWGRRWIDVLEKLYLGARLDRGRTYARKGQVAELGIASGAVTAQVQGSRPKPYKVDIKLKAFSQKQWTTVTQALADRPVYAAKLLAGEMPEDIEEVFTAAGVSLFPQSYDDLDTHCSCPDRSNPCKHIAAVYYLLAEAFDSDPFLLLRLRGMDRDALMAALGGAEPVEAEPPAPPEPLPEEADAFWRTADVPAPGGLLAAPSIHAPLVRRLGKFSFWRGSEGLIDVMDRIYRTASEHAFERLDDLAGD